MKLDNNYSKAYKEIMEILKFVPKESIDKIPQTMLDTFKAKMDQNYIFEINIDKSFEDQELLDETKAIFANIFRDYWATPYQKEIIEQKEKYDRKKIEEKKKAKYNPDSIFNKINTTNLKEKIKETNINNLPIELKKEKFYEKLINFIKNILKFERNKQ